MIGPNSVIWSLLILATILSICNGKSRESWLTDLYTYSFEAETPRWIMGYIQFFNFQVKTCERVSIQLEAYSLNYMAVSYRIDIGNLEQGADERKGIAIYKPLEGENPWVMIDGDDFLNCSEYRSFWINWADGKIKVGSGLNEQKGEVIIEKNDTNPAHVNVVTVNSLGDAGWRVERHPSVAVTNIQHHSIGITVQYTRHLIFEVKPCWSYHVILTDESDHGIGIFLARGDLIEIMDLRNPAVLASLKKDLYSSSCEEYIQFWVSWSKKAIKVGTGFIVGKDLLLQTKFKKPDNKKFMVKSIYLEKELDADATRLPATKCQVGFWYHPEFGTCYNFVYDKRMPYKLARKFCRKLGGYLAVVDTMEENNFIKDTLTADEENADFLLGGRRSKPKIDWVWKDHPLRFPAFNYTDWRHREPNNPNTEKCIAVNTDGWNDVSCFYAYQFICEASSV